MISAEDELKIFENILSQSPEGLSDPNLIGKFSKAKSFLHAQQSLEQMNSQNIAPVMPNQSVTATNSTPVDTSTPLGENPSNMPQSQPPIQNEGQGSLQLP